MRAKFISEAFKEDSDPIQDMGIGTLEITSDFSTLKRLPISELDEIYKRVRQSLMGAVSVQVMVDGTMIDVISHFSKIDLNNNIVKAMKYVRSIKNRDKSRSQDLKAGDAIKCEIKGKWYMGYAQFSKRGILKTDGHGRIVTKTTQGLMKVPADFAVKLSPKEQKAFDKEFFYIRKAELEKYMVRYKEWSLSRYKIYKDEYDELMRTKKISVIA